MKKSCESLYNLFWIFIVGCVVGWFVEGVFSLIKWKEFINHSAVVIGPFNMAYGLGALMLTALLYKFRNEKNIKIINIKYEDLKKVWCEEFMKVLQFINNDLEIVRGREEVLERLNNLYKPSKANLLYNFYCAIQLNGLKDTKNNMPKRTYYRNVKELKEAKIDFSQSYKVEEVENIYYFNPFEFKEVV